MTDIPSGNKITPKGIALILSAGALLLIAFSVSAYFLYIVPKQQADKLEFEKQKFEQTQKDKEDKTQAEAQKIEDERIAEADKQLALEGCLFDAKVSYGNNWQAYCAIWKSEVSDTYEDCKKNWLNLGWELQKAKDWCWTNTPDYNTQENDGSCLLPTKYSSKVQTSLQEAKDECYKKYPVK